MTAASLAKAGPGFWGRGDFLARRGLEFEFLRRWEGFFGGMRAFFPEGITLRRAEGFDKRSGGGKKERRREGKRVRAKERERRKALPQRTERGPRRSQRRERLGAECAEDAEFTEKSGEDGRSGLGDGGSSLPVINWERFQHRMN